MSVLGIIPARGGSKRVPRKNIKLLGGKPLIAWTIETSKQAQLLDYFLVSTNDEEIMSISKKYGAPVPFKRPAKISEDVDTVFPLQHAVEFYEEKKGKEVSHVVCLQPTSPFKLPSDIDECIRIAKVTGVETVISVSKIQQHPMWAFELKSFTHELEPYMNNVKMEGDNLVSQNLPTLFYPNGAVYVIRRDILMNGRIYGDQIYGFMMPSERSIDLEEELDFIKAEAIIPYLANKEPFLKQSWLIS